MRPFPLRLRRLAALPWMRPVAQSFLLTPVLGATAVRCAVPLLRLHSTVVEPLRPLRHRMYDDFIALWRRKLLYFRIAGGVAAASIALVAYAMWDRGWLLNTSKGGVLSTFVAGGIFSGSESDPFEDADRAADVARYDLHLQLVRLLRPVSIQTYAVVVGEHGTGKSTAVRKAARAASKDGANGVVYFLIGEVPTISTDLAKCLLVGREYDARQALLRRLFSESSTQKNLAWHNYNTIVKEAATAFRRKYNRPMTLVIDGVHKLASDDPKFLDNLQDFAKDAADTGSLNVVFVSSYKTALAHMKSRSSWSRAAKPLEIGDIPDDDAIAFIKRRHGMEHNHAAELVHDVTGGRFSLLLDPSVAVQSVAAIRDEKYNETDTQLTDLGLEPTHPFFRALVESKVVTTKAARTLLGGKEKIEELLLANIIAAHVDGTYTVHSRYVGNFLSGRVEAEKELQKVPVK